MKRLKLCMGPYYAILIVFVISLFFLSICRTCFLVYYHSRIPDPVSLARVLASGLRIDVVTAVYCVSLPVLIAPFLEGYRYTHPFYRGFLRAWFSVWMAGFVLMETITPAFIAAYDVRPNRLFIEYMEYPEEVFSMLVKGYLSPVILGFSAMVLGTFLTFRLVGKLTVKPSSWHPVSKFALLPVLCLLLFIGGRSSLGHRPVNPSTVAFSNAPLVNDLALNSTYSLLYAIYRMKDEGNASSEYGSMDTSAVFQRVHQAMGIPGELFQNPDIPTEHLLTASNQKTSPMNLVIILEESLGAEFVESLGGLPLTPNLESLSSEGLWFEDMYATGTRSVRGIEAVICGFPPTPGRSVVKLGKSQNRFFTLARVLSAHGYNTRFIYGGDSNFDNMKKFFLGNGFQDVYDEKDYKKPMFKGSWGVSDQDLFVKTHEILLKESDQPSFSLVFTSSNHPPFEFPGGTIDLYENPKNTLNNAVKYADFALGDFFAKARKAPYWRNTLFLVVADHNSHTAGESLVPIDRFRIPALIIGPLVKPGIYRQMASQIDLPPTLLSLLGISCVNPMIGRDLTRKSDSLPGRAILQYYQYQAYMTGEKVSLLQPGQKIDHFIFKDRRLIPARSDEDHGQTALAHALWASWAYNNRAYFFEEASVAEKDKKHFRNAIALRTTKGSDVIEGHDKGLFSP